MASLKFLVITAVLTVGAHAKFVWQDDDDFPAFPHLRMPVPPTPPFRPFAPTPPFAPFAPFPPFGPGFGQFQNFPNFPNFHIPLPVVPTPGQIRNVKPGPGQVFSGMAVKSTSSYTRDKDGNIVRTGGTSVLSNDNGNVMEFKNGNAPPNIDEPVQAPTMPKMEPLKFPKMKPLEFPKMKPLEFPKMKPFEFDDFEMPKFKPIEPIKPIDIEEIKNYVPKKGETFVASSSSSFSNSQTVNGKTVATGGASKFVNDNGKTAEEVVAFHKGDKDDEK